MTRRPLCDVFAASCTTDGGIFGYRLFSDGALTETARIPVDRPMYFIKRGDVFHTLLRAPDGLGGMSGYAACRFGQAVPAPVSTGGRVACHLTVTNRRIYAVNYLSGSVSMIGGMTVTHTREMLRGIPHPTKAVPFAEPWQRERLALQAGRQDASHPHQIIPAPDGRFLLTADLGLDAVFVYDLELNLCGIARTPRGSGARHMVFGVKQKDGSYPLFCVCELDAAVCTFSYRDGQLTFLCAASSHIARPDNTAAAIRLSPDGKTLFASHRGEDCISAFDVGESGQLTWLYNAACGGRDPRDFCLTPAGDFLISANEGDGCLTVLPVAGNRVLPPVTRVALPSALCVWAE